MVGQSGAEREIHSSGSATSDLGLGATVFD
jgi:hypothetical protein